MLFAGIHLGLFSSSHTRVDDAYDGPKPVIPSERERSSPFGRNDKGRSLTGFAFVPRPACGFIALGPQNFNHGAQSADRIAFQVYSQDAPPALLKRRIIA